MRKTLLLLSTLIFLISPMSAFSEILTGSYYFYRFGNVAAQDGPLIFGYVPEGPIAEVAFDSITVYTNDFSSQWPSGDLSIPVPQYEDGTYANEWEILFAVRFNDVRTFSDFIVEISATWTGGPDLHYNFHSADWQDFAYLKLEITSIAFREGSVGAAPLNFGQLKTLFE